MVAHGTNGNTNLQFQVFWAMQLYGINYWNSGKLKKLCCVFQHQLNQFSWCVFEKKIEAHDCDNWVISIIDR